ncbi:hypothetical protein NDU88_007192 [Pleurodeles waltl]|uniref:Uncharacterized protein n=1 Tax=Pleurodeles waltl TaxID=8319 RepID=A0AAV7TZR4_PLEWA|nr:hypothetical protein NDU88_007192 [Pleurodeles waltl]
MVADVSTPMCRVLATIKENAGSLRRGSDGFRGALLWIRAALELRKSHRAALHVPLRGIMGRASKNRAAVKPVAERLQEVEDSGATRAAEDVGSGVESVVRQQLRGLPSRLSEKEPRGCQKRVRGQNNWMANDKVWEGAKQKNLDRLAGASGSGKVQSTTKI